jgi:hypothetical protein
MHIQRWLSGVKSVEIGLHSGGVILHWALFASDI